MDEYGYIVVGENSDKAALDFVINNASGSAVMVSFYDRSQSSVRAIAAGFQGKNGCSYQLTAPTGQKYTRPRRGYAYGGKDLGFSGMVAPVCSEKDTFYHALCTSPELGKRAFLATESTFEELLFSHLMNNYDLPLLKEWTPVLGKALMERGHLQKSLPPIIGAYSGNPTLELLGKTVPVEQISCYTLNLAQDRLEDLITSLMKKGIISFGSHMMAPLTDVESMDAYFNKHGKSIVENLEQHLTPLTGLEGDVNDFTLKHRRLYPQQAVMVHGMKALLLGVGKNRKERRRTSSSYCIVNEGMGTGKTLQSAALCEAVGVAEQLNKGATLKDVYEQGSEGANYRNIVMCPGHLVEKWAEEIRSEIPFARVEILNDLEQLVQIKARGIERKGREFYIIGKDFAKLSYAEKPTPTKVRIQHLYQKECANPKCYRVPMKKTCPSCKGTEYKLRKLNTQVEGLICPHCKQLLLDSSMKDYDADAVLQPKDFAKHNATNSSCFYCGETLWQPHVANLTLPGAKSKEPVWIRATHYANKSHKTTDTVWVHREHQEKYFASVGEKPLNYPAGAGTRRYAPGSYIKKQLKGFFDIAIFDEVHTLKGGATAQGNTMHSLIKASKKQLGLTGTIAGGYANHLFYLLFRLDPARMIEKGFDFNSEMSFSKKYGCVDTEYAVNETRRGTYNSTSKGRKLGSPKCKPGISPLIFTDFLLDKTVFLDITDMSAHMPPLKEKVELVFFEREHGAMEGSYKHVIDCLKTEAMNGSGMAVMSKMLQFSLSYLDKPYGVGPIINPLDGSKIVEPKSFDEYSSLDNLLPKEKRMVELVTSELAEGRNCFIYAEYTGSPETCVTHRWREVLMKYCGLKENEVVILESASPAAKEREAWIHKKAAAGAKVFITNPKCVETGLDFVFKYDGRSYNYPTLIFMQMGYNLFTIWQASRRHYRLIQKEECRTYYVAYAGTIQEAVIGLIAEKMSATSAIQGKFSAEGLSAMASGVDARVKLAKALSDMDSQTGADLQGMFDVVNSMEGVEDEYSNYTPMKLLYEIIDSALVERTADEKADSAFEVLDLMQSMKHVRLFTEPTTEPTVAPSTEQIVAPSTVEQTVAPSTEPAKETKTVSSGGFDVLNFFLNRAPITVCTDVSLLGTVTAEKETAPVATLEKPRKKKAPKEERYTVQQTSLFAMLGM